MLPESRPASLAAAALPANLASRPQNKPCQQDETATPGCPLAFQTSCPTLRPPPSIVLHALESPRTPPQHTVQTAPSPPLLYENCSRYTSSGRTAPVRKSPASPSHKNSSTPVPKRTYARGIPGRECCEWGLSGRLSIMWNKRVYNSVFLWGERRMKNRARSPYFISLLLTACAFLTWTAAPSKPDAADDSWPYYGHDAGGMRYSPLTQINRENVARLKVAWTFHTGDISEGAGRRKRSGFETTPILVDGTLYLTTAFNRIIALDPETGKQRWAYDPKIDLDGDYGDGLVNRGVATWLDSTRPADQPCRRRIFE